jgi:phosphopantothenoylcysteine decarboxylase/phosphopantothenate--cysteine ligase
MGIAVADAAYEYGADVRLVLGPVSIRPLNKSILITHVTTAESMAEECIKIFPECDIAVLAAAVADFTPVIVAGEKMKKSSRNMVIDLKPTRDIAEILGRSKNRSQLVAGFALETDNEIENAKTKLKRKNLDLIVLNSLQDQGAGFGFDTNRITIIDRNNIIDKFELKSKEEAARDILDKIVSMLNIKSE